MLHMQAYQHNGWSFAETGDHPGAAGNPERIKLFPAGRLDHAVEFLEVEARMSPQLVQVEGRKQEKHLGRCLANWQFGSYDGFIKGRADFNLHPPTFGQSSQPPWPM